MVFADVVAEPLPEGVEHREAIVRFEFPGAYLDYKFMQGVKVIPPLDPCFPEINISHVNYCIYLILNDMYDNCYDVNKDDEVNIADVNALIDLILKN